jgi:hypothetical protein
MRDFLRYLWEMVRLGCLLVAIAAPVVVILWLVGVIR